VNVYAITINAIAFSYYENNEIYTPMKDEFNKYSKENNLDIELNLNFLTNANGSNSIEEYESVVESLLKKKNSKKKKDIDIYFYDCAYTNKYGPYLINLHNILPKDHIDMYNPKILSETCLYEDYLVGLPVYLDYTYLHSNKSLLKKYNKNVPTTWKELLDTAKYILKQEKESYNNTNLIGYFALLEDNEIGTCSIHDFIYSNRPTVDSSFPELTSKDAIDALELLKKIKEEISSDIGFKSKMSYKLNELINGNYIFSNFYYASLGTNNISLLPGSKKGISGNIIVGYNVGIGKYSDESKRNAVITVFKFLTSKEIQKKFVLEKGITSPIPSIYDDEKVCEKVDCELMKNIQPFGRFANKTENYYTYSSMFRNEIYKFLYGDKSASEVLKNVEDLSKIYYIPILDTKETSIGLISVIIMIVLSVIMILSTVFLFIDKYKSYFNFLSTDFWFISIIGSIIIISTCFTGMGEKKILKCHFKILTLSLGFTFNLIPVLHKLIINFPERNKFSNWCRRNKYIFLFIFIAFDLLLLTTHFVSAYKIETIIVSEGKNFQICNLCNGYAIFITYLVITIKLLILGTILLLIYSEWNMENTYYDLRFLISVIYTDTLSVIILLIAINKLIKLVTSVRKD